jgi:hypothetical protein
VTVDFGVELWAYGPQKHWDTGYIEN